MKSEMTYQEYLNDITVQCGFSHNISMSDPESVDEFVRKYSILFPIGSKHYEQCRKFICEMEYINKNRNEYILVRDRGTGLYSFELRSEVEWNPRYIQIVSLGILRTEDNRLIGVRSTKTDINNKITFVGGHISYENMSTLLKIDGHMTHTDLSGVAGRNMCKEISEELGIQVQPNSIDMIAKNIINYIYMPHHISYYHEPIFFIVNISNKELGYIEMEDSMEPIIIDGTKKTLPYGNSYINLLNGDIVDIEIETPGDGTRRIPQLDQWFEDFLIYYSNSSR